ncbi:MAG: substrate-binding domain-containing protein [Chitinophagales bacterium]|nr:substrate-binding domain-containing protein [Chitinophagales bacterium]
MKAFYGILILLIGLASCKQETSIKDFKNSPVVGEAEIWCDESLRNVIEEEVDIFLRAYANARLTVHYAPEMVIKRKFYADSIDVMIISHGLDSIELAGFHQREVWPRQYVFGKSSIAFIGHKDRTALKFTYDQMLDMLSSPNYTFAIENKNSGLAYELTNHLKGKSLSDQVYALESKEAIIAWLDQNPDGIGVIDWSNVADDDDSAAVELLNQVSILQIAGVIPETRDHFYGPEQMNMNGYYPFTRDLYIIRRVGITNVTLGFASFVCEDRGQKILLKAGLLPEYQSERWIEFKGLGDFKVIED